MQLLTALALGSSNVKTGISCSLSSNVNNTYLCYYKHGSLLIINNCRRLRRLLMETMKNIGHIKKLLLQNKTSKFWFTKIKLFEKFDHNKV